MTDLLDAPTTDRPTKLRYNDKGHAYWLDGKRAKSVTTVAKVPEDGYALELWGKRMVAIGMASAPHLVESVAAHFDDRDKVNELVEEAETVARTHAAATRGTAMHRVTERADRGEAMLLTDLLADTVQAWRDALDLYGYDIVPEYIERAVVYPQQRICGRFDRIVRRRSDGRLRILDLKSGERALKYPHSISIQLALYANAPWMAGGWDGESGETNVFEPLPELDRDTALVLHMPEPGKATIAEVNIRAGWTIAYGACFPILGWRDRSDLVTVVELELRNVAVDDEDDPFASFAQDRHHDGEPVKPTPSLQADPPHLDGEALSQPVTLPAAAPPAETLPLARVDWIAARITALPPAGLQLLGIRWPQDVRPAKAMRAIPTRDYDDAEISAIDAVLMPIEREHEMPLSPDPCAVHVPGCGAPLEKRQERAKAAGGTAIVCTRGKGCIVVPIEQITGSSVPSNEVEEPKPVQVSAPDEGDMVGDDDIEAIRKANAALTGDELALGVAWLTEMRDAGLPLRLAEVRSRRRWSIARAILALVPNDDELARAALTVVLGEVDPATSTGAALGQLSVDEAERLAGVAGALAAGTLCADYSTDTCVLIPA